MDSLYPVEKEQELEKIIFPKFSKPIIFNKTLKIDEKASKRNITKIIYTNGAYYERADLELVFSNGEKFKGLLSEDLCKIKRGNYFWPDGQEYYGDFDEKNNFVTKEGEVSKLTFSKGGIFEGTFENGEICEGKYVTADGREMTADFTGGKINGLIIIDDQNKNFKFKGYIMNNKKEGPCELELKLKNKIYSIKGEYANGFKDGKFKIAEIYPNKDGFYIKGKYKMGLRHGYFDIIDKDKNIDIKRQYISFYNTFLIEQYNKSYKPGLTDKTNSISITCRNNPIKQIEDLVKIRLCNLITLDLSRNKLKNISFLNTEEKTLFSLHNLILSYNDIENIEPLVDVYYPKLKKLILNDNKINSIKCVQNFKFEELEELNLSSNPIDSLEGVELWKFPNLFDLSLYRTNISDIKPLTEAEFPSLAEIDICCTKINPNKKIYPKHFKKCKSLRKVSLIKSH